MIVVASVAAIVVAFATVLALGAMNFALPDTES